MKREIIFIALFFIAGCGPKEIGEGAAASPPSLGSPSSAAEIMRYPAAGASPTQKMLYNANRPEVMEAVQRWQESQLRNKAAIQPEDPAYREKPAVRSPFKQ